MKHKQKNLCVEKFPTQELLPASLLHRNGSLFLLSFCLFREKKRETRKIESLLWQAYRGKQDLGSAIDYSRPYKGKGYSPGATRFGFADADQETRVGVMMVSRAQKTKIRTYPRVGIPRWFSSWRRRGGRRGMRGKSRRVGTSRKERANWRYKLRWQRSRGA